MEVKAAEQEKRRQLRRLEKKRIQDIYDEMAGDYHGTQVLWSQLVEAMDAYARPAVIARLQRTQFHKDEDVETVCSMAHEALYREKTFTGYRRRVMKDPDTMFADYCRKIYVHKTIDYMAERLRIAGSTVDIDDEEHGPVLGTVTPFYEGLSAGELFLKYYVDEVTGGKDNRFHAVMLCYSKILPVILDLTGCGASDKWAWQVMQKTSMNDLSLNFIDIFNATMLHLRAAWGEYHNKAMQKEYKSRSGKRIPMSQVILTDEFTKDNTKNWVSRLNTSVMDRCVKRIMAENDEDLMLLVAMHKRSEDLK